jgi:hypothetical protein
MPVVSFAAKETLGEGGNEANLNQETNDRFSSGQKCSGC